MDDTNTAAKLRKLIIDKYVNCIIFFPLVVLYGVINTWS